MCAHWTHEKPAKSAHIAYCLVIAYTKLNLQLKELKNYAFVNAEGFRKIIKKYDKRLPTQTLYAYAETFAECNFTCHNALHIAAQRGHAQMVQRLLGAM